MSCVQIPSPLLSRKKKKKNQPKSQNTFCTGAHIQLIQCIRGAILYFLVLEWHKRAKEAPDKGLWGSAPVLKDHSRAAQAAGVGREAHPAPGNHKQPRQADFKVSAHKSSAPLHVRNNFFFFFFQTSSAKWAQSAASWRCRCCETPPGAAQEPWAEDSQCRTIPRAQASPQPLSCSPGPAGGAERASESVSHMVNRASSHHPAG